MNAPLKAILIDDELNSLQNLQNKLEKYCPLVKVLASYQKPEEAIPVIRQQKPDVLFLDIAMTKKDGKAALAEIMAAHPDAKVVMVTALDDMDTIQECTAKGAVAYIVKPFNLDDIKRAISVALD